MTTHCAPCIADLALLREAKTTISGTAACVAHAVLLLHPGDSAQQRLARLAELRSNAEGKMATASADDIPDLELLIQEYALAGAMDMTVPLRDLAGDRTPRPPKTRNRGRDRERGERGGEQRGERGGEQRGERGGRDRGPRPERTETPSDAPAETPADVTAEAPAAGAPEVVAEVPSTSPVETVAEAAAAAPSAPEPAAETAAVESPAE